jgi:hypothetical protein
MATPRLVEPGPSGFLHFEGQSNDSGMLIFLCTSVHLVSDVIPSGVLATSYNPRHESNNLHYHKTIANVAAHRITSQ